MLVQLNCVRRRLLYLLNLGVVGSLAGRRSCVVGLSLLVGPVLGDAAVRGVYVLCAVDLSVLHSLLGGTLLKFTIRTPSLDLNILVAPCSKDSFGLYSSREG